MIEKLDLNQKENDLENIFVDDGTNDWKFLAKINELIEHVNKQQERLDEMSADFLSLFKRTDNMFTLIKEIPIHEQNIAFLYKEIMDKGKKNEQTKTKPPA